MSNSVSALVERRRVGSSTQKSIMLIMADKASDDGTGIWISQGTVAARLELSKRAVQKNTQALVELGLICAAGKKQHANGYTVNYSINLSAVLGLPEVKDCTGEPSSPVTVVHRTGESAALHGVNDVHPNHPVTIHEPPSRTDAREVAVSEFEKIWTTYPNDKHRNKTACQDHFRRAVSEGADPSHILAAVGAYASETRGFSRSKVCHSDNWFRDVRWKHHVPANTVADPAKAADVVDGFKRAIIANNAILARHCPAQIARELVAAGEVSIEQCRAVGISA